MAKWILPAHRLSAISRDAFHSSTSSSSLSSLEIYKKSNSFPQCHYHFLQISPHWMSYTWSDSPTSFCEVREAVNPYGQPDHKIPFFFDGFSYHLTHTTHTYLYWVCYISSRSKQTLNSFDLCVHWRWSGRKRRQGSSPWGQRPCWFLLIDQCLCGGGDN